ncbi:hypothetical protein T440DRAFT_4302 [Plenodomus tracheiphilus IPT5]|uniref:Uncharacterized protein n=1 Tax=Plenodomus tracheiphilus IPT5 TaxID=1408161 RepID=A0A6A7BP10_9PLEO|nr:hypothetical protein T440DRAFT_4302 [Plenodomus tracheiphilus IPT5]
MALSHPATNIIAAPQSLFTGAGESSTLSTINDRHFPDGGVALSPTETTFGNSAHPRRNLASDTPCRRANVRTRRSQHGSVLTQSPARAGHASRMHQIFEDAGRGHTASAGARGVLYPQLPNISRRASPLKHKHTQDTPNVVGGESDFQPESSCRSTGSIFIGSQADPPPTYRLPVTERTSGSWSDDSGYIVADISRKSGILVSPSQRIQDWLLTIDEAVGFEATAEGTEERHIQHTDTTQPRVHAEVRYRLPADNIESLSSSVALSYSWTEPTASLLAVDKANDPFVSNDLVHVRSTPWVPRNSCRSIRIPPVPDRFKEYVSDSCERLKFDQTTSKTAAKIKSDAEKTVTPRKTPAPIRPQYIRASGSENSDAQGDGGIELSPLSPNVCIERGPSRYHKSPKSPIIKQVSSKYKNRPPFLMPRPSRFKENLETSPVSDAGEKGFQTLRAPLRLRARQSQENTVVVPE